MTTTKHTTEAVSAAIRAEIARRRVPVAEVRAALGGMLQNSWHRRMTGETAWSVDEVAQVAAFLEVPLSQLMPADDAAAVAR